MRNETDMKGLMEGIDPLAVWGAILSTVLAVVKLWEIWKDRTRIEVSHNFTGSPDIGNEVIIRNLTGTPLIFTYWELIWRHKRRFRWKQSKEITPNEFFQDLKVGGHSSIKLSFREQDYFDWGVSALGNDRIYLRLHIAGKAKPIVRKVYG